MLRRAFYHITLALTLVLCMGLQSNRQEMPLPVKDQMPLFLKILSYDKNLSDRGDEIVIGVLYQERYRASLLAKDEVLTVMKQFETVSGHPIRLVPIDLDAQDALRTRLEEKDVNIVYVAPLRAFDLQRLTSLSRSHSILTLTGVPNYLGEGLSVSLDVQRNKPLILINLPASEAEGAKFHSQLLKFAQVTR